MFPSSLIRRQSSASPRTFFVIIDLEPDPPIGGEGDDIWRGAKDSFARIELLRSRLVEATGHPANFSWMVRADRHIERTFGDASHLLRRFGADFERLHTAGDLIGAHIHSFAESHDFETYTDDALMVRDVETSAAAFDAAFGHPPTSVGFARGWTTPPVLEACRRFGIALDMSVITDLTGVEQNGAVTIEAGPQDNSNLPRHPYLPSPSDWRSSAEATSTPDGPVIVPLTGIPIGAWRSRRDLRRLEPAASDRQRLIHHAFLAGVLHPRFLRSVARGDLVQRPYISLSARSSRFSHLSDDDMGVIAQRLIIASGGRPDVCTPLQSSHVTRLLPAA